MSQEHRLSFWLLFTIALAAAVFSCHLAYLGESPPSETVAGADPAFDNLLVSINSGRAFLFDEGDRLIATGLCSGSDTVLIDLPDLTGVQSARSFGRPALSPDRRWLVLPYLTGLWAERNKRHLAVLDLATGLTEVLTIPHFRSDSGEGTYELDMWSRDLPFPHWIGANTFVVSLIWYPPERADLYRLKFLRYDLGHFDAPLEIDIGLRRPHIRIGTGGALLVADGDEPSNSPTWPSIRVLSAHGQRPASEDERHTFRIARMDNQPGGPEKVVGERRSQSWFLEEAGYDWAIRFNGRLIRRTTKVVEGIRWESDLGLYTWSESNHEVYYFIAAPDGRYRRWHRGSYIGAISTRP